MRGAQLIRAYGCGTCHRIPGVTGADGTVGPPLEHLAKRAYIGGVLPNKRSEMVRWLVNPQAVDPRTAMPNVGLDEGMAHDIAAYLGTLE